MRQLDFEIWNIVIALFMDMKLDPGKFNALDARKQNEIYNSVRFLTKEKMPPTEISSEIRGRAYKAVDKAVSNVLFA